MMASQEIVEQFRELISVRLPIIEAQRECPIDLKEAISSVCFAAPRYADLPELLQVQMLFAGIWEGVHCCYYRAHARMCVNRQELLKSHEDLLNGPTQFVSGAKVPLPKERFDEVQHSVSDQVYDKQTESDADFDSLDFPEVPKQQPLRHSTGGVSAPEMLPFPASALSDFDEDKAKPSEYGEFKSHKQNVEQDEVLQEKVVSKDSAPEEEKQFLPFMVPPPKSSPFSTESTTTKSTQPPSTTMTKDDIDVDLQDVLAAAASLAQVRISELTRKRSEEVPVSPSENPFYAEKQEAHILEKLPLELQHQLSNSDGISSPLHGSPLESNNPSYDDPTVG
ncbi:hypothetical protein K7X08_002258 [Anisodus acutangulus]|uniref:Uncharacterized protein n=1 Tax=Anisodus acutangulus TaxID=402998 RepID=A0A9Q1LP54_9SOLA|nr:hypothetical protein K7X08_002258 [Anisodus acutangulus]